MAATGRMTGLRATAEAWLADDPDPRTRAALEALLDDDEALDALFCAPLSFGTAGLRGELGPGPGRMNRRVVALTTRGLCDYLAATVPNAKRRGLCIARDARHGSTDFTREAIEVALGAGFHVHAFSAAVPTPLLAFSVLHRQAAGGVMVTASHNPKAYNGYKVYFENGAQVIPPHDTGITDAIARVASVMTLARMTKAEGLRLGALVHMDGDVDEAYARAVSELLGQRRPTTPPRLAYTPLHGVAKDWALRTLGDAGFTDVHVVRNQADPDPDFPTVAFPNPEERGAVDALIELAEGAQADLAIAHDPDGDRLALCARDHTGRFRLLTGNQTGLLLADYALERLANVADGRLPLICSTVVSSPMVARIAQAHHARLEWTLTGFKWLCNRAMQLEQMGHHFVFAFEDAMGYAVGSLVRDKDGLSAAVLAAQLAEQCRDQGISLWDRLDALFATHGHFASAQHSEAFHGTDGFARMERFMDDLRRAPPAQIGERAVIERRDLLRGTAWDSQGERVLELPQSDVLIFALQGEQRVCIRPSGTEPKLKLYFDVRTPAQQGESRLDLSRRAAHNMTELIANTLSAMGLAPARSGPG